MKAQTMARSWILFVVAPAFTFLSYFIGKSLYAGLWLAWFDFEYPMGLDTWGWYCAAGVTLWVCLFICYAYLGLWSALHPKLWHDARLFRK